MNQPVQDELFAGLDVPYEADVPLGPRTWYGVGGRARWLAMPESVDQLSELLARAHHQHLQVYALGLGANLLVAEDVDGLVVQLAAPAFQGCAHEDGRLTVGAGVDLFKLVLQAAREGLSGPEMLAGIPGSVGGAVRMNAGGAFGEIGSLVRRVRVMSDAGQVQDYHADDLSFTYRRSNIAAPFILEAELEVGQEDPDVLMRRVKEIFLYKKTSQPMGASSSGCAFKNPPGESAGRLIDRAGLKGYQIGGAHVSEVHANFITAEQDATAADVVALLEHIAQTVQEQFGVKLEREVVVWP